MLKEEFIVAVHLQNLIFDRMEMTITMDLADLVFITYFDKGFESAVVPGRRVWFTRRYRGETADL